MSQLHGLPSASSFSCQRSLIAEVIRLGKAVLKIKVSHVSQHLCLDGYKAFEGNIHRGEQSAALSSPSARFSAAGKMALKRNFILQTMFWLVSLEKQEVRVQKKSTLFWRVSFEVRMYSPEERDFDHI